MGRKWINRGLDWLYPPECYFCGCTLTQGRSLCEECIDSLLKLETPFCSCCGEPFEGVIHADFICPNCGGLDLAFDFARSALRNSERARELVYGLKYRRQSAFRA